MGCLGASFVALAGPFAVEELFGAGIKGLAAAEEGGATPARWRCLFFSAFALVFAHSFLAET